MTAAQGAVLKKTVTCNGIATSDGQINKCLEGAESSTRGVNPFIFGTSGGETLFKSRAARPASGQNYTESFQQQEKP
jgi:hypothetical protein